MHALRDCRSEFVENPHISDLKLHEANADVTSLQSELRVTVQYLQRNRMNRNAGLEGLRTPQNNTNKSECQTTSACLRYTECSAAYSAGFARNARNRATNRSISFTALSAFCSSSMTCANCGSKNFSMCWRRRLIAETSCNGNASQLLPSIARTLKVSSACKQERKEERRLNRS
jgi:hypothetical protein